MTSHVVTMTRHHATQTRHFVTNTVVVVMKQGVTVTISGVVAMKTGVAARRGRVTQGTTPGEVTGQSHPVTIPVVEVMSTTGSITMTRGR
jgi:hypothetical protein